MPLIILVSVAAAFEAGLAVSYAFKAADTPKDDRDKRARYIKLTVLFTGLSVLLLGLSRGV